LTRGFFSQAGKEQNCVRVKQATLAGAAVGKIIGTWMWFFTFFLLSSEAKPTLAGCGSYAVGATAGILTGITSARLDRKIDEH